LCESIGERAAQGSNCDWDRGWGRGRGSGHRVIVEKN
jgi:hypothetical protein